MSSDRYVLITPCRNEADFARHTLDTVTRQSIPPSKWIIVNDGSTDETEEILTDYARRFDYITVISREDRGRRSVGPGVIDAFYVGLDAVNLNRYDYLCKLDLDLRLPPCYFERLIERMQDDRLLGTCSGKAYYVHPATGKHVSEMIGDEMSVGAAKFYRTECFRQIGGFVRAVMWDGIDCHRCRMIGWRAASWDDPDLRIIHLRPMGSSQAGIWKGRVRHGAGQYFMGTGFAYMTASALFRMTQPPRVVGGVAIFWGYLVSMLKRNEQYQDQEFQKYLRTYQRRALVRGKQAAIKAMERGHFQHRVTPALSQPIVNSAVK